MKLYECTYCGFKIIKLTNYNLHFKTKKHLKKIKQENEQAIEQPIIPLLLALLHTSPRFTPGATAFFLSFLVLSLRLLILLLGIC